MLCLGLLLVGATALVMRWFTWHEPQVPVIPAVAEVAEMRISLSQHCFGSEGMAEFTVPQEHVPGLLGWLQPTEYIRKPWRLEWLKAGEVIIKTTDGGEMRLRFYDAGVNPAVLSADGVDQFYGPDYQGRSKYGSDRLATSRYGAIGFADAIYAAYWDSQKQGKQERD
jgi:hypothetical protein